MSPEIRKLFDALPAHLQEQALGVLPLRSFVSPTGSTADDAARARFESEVRRLHTAYVATSGTAPGSGGNRGPTLPQDRRGAGGAMPGHPRVSSATGATAAASAAVAAAVQEERRRLLAERWATDPLPANIDAALTEVDRRILAAASSGSPELASTIFRKCIADLWTRPDVLSTFATRDELLAYFDMRASGGIRRAER